MKRLIITSLLLLASGCASLTGFVEHAQRDLGALKPELQEKLKTFSEEAEKRQEHCKSLELDTPEARAKCLGPYDPDGELFKVADTIKQWFDSGADDLGELLKALELFEALKEKASK